MMFQNTYFIMKASFFLRSKIVQWNTDSQTLGLALHWGCLLFLLVMLLPSTPCSAGGGGGGRQVVCVYLHSSFCCSTPGVWKGKVMSQKVQSKRTSHQFQLIKPLYSKNSTQKWLEMALVLFLPCLAGVGQKRKYNMEKLKLLLHKSSYRGACCA